MKIVTTSIRDAYLVETHENRDERGSFRRVFCTDEFLKNGLNPNVSQCSISSNIKAGTLRGMHYQEVPFEEAKLVQCIRGAIYDVVLDIRENSPTFGRWESFDLAEEKPVSLYVGEGLAHGFLSLRDSTDVYYQISQPFRAERSLGIRWNDPRFGIRWPVSHSPILSQKDSLFPDFVGS